jgi:adenosylhomocysteine nucleosidase
MKTYSLIIAAMEVELNALLEQLPHYQKINFKDEELYEANFHNEDYLIGLGKIGKVHTACYLTKILEHFKIKRIFNIGTSGGVNSTLSISDVIIATKVAYHDVDVTEFGYVLGQMCGCEPYFTCDLDYVHQHHIDKKYVIHEGLIVSGDSFISRNKFLASNIKKFDGALACDMEAGALGQVASLYHIPFVVVRSISDIVTENDNYHTHKDQAKATSTNSALVLLELLK